MARAPVLAAIAAIAIAVSAAQRAAAVADTYTYGCYYPYSNCGVPGVPQNVRADADNKAACVSWTPPVFENSQLQPYQYVVKVRSRGPSFDSTAPDGRGAPRRRPPDARRRRRPPRAQAVPTGGWNYLLAKTVTATATGTSYCLRGLMANVVYWVKVAAVNQYGQGDFSTCGSFYADCSVALYYGSSQKCNICSGGPPPPDYGNAPSPPYNVRAPVYGSGTQYDPYIINLSVRGDPRSAPTMIRIGVRTARGNGARSFRTDSCPVLPAVEPADLRRPAGLVHHLLHVLHHAAAEHVRPEYRRFREGFQDGGVLRDGADVGRVAADVPVLDNRDEQPRLHESAQRGDRADRD